jgi:leader peptidase (prepilin peptidase)/N-methyltransferase
MHTVTLHRESPPMFLLVAPAGAMWCLIALIRPDVVGLSVATSLAVAELAAFVDIRTRRLPDVLVLATAAPAVVGAFLTDHVDTVLLGALVFAAPVLVVHTVSPAAMGFGDVKFAAALGGAVGLLHPIAALVALCVASGLTAGVGLLRRSGSLPFGPGLVAGSVATVVASAAFPNSLSEGRLPWQ